MTTEIVTLQLPRTLAPALAAGHPWIYRDHLPGGLRLPAGSWVRVRSGTWTGFALSESHSSVALRVFSECGVPDAHWIAQRVRAAWDLRAPLRDGGTTAYRWLNGEGDGLPGIVVDLYGACAALVTYTPSVEPLVSLLVDALQETAPLRCVVRRSSAPGSHPALELLWGRRPPRDLVVEEHGVRLRADLYAGQKTGLFLDQRENRRYLAALATGRRVLSLFSYTGGFALHAALAGATGAVSVDRAEAALAAARDNFELNGVDPDGHEFVNADAFQFLQQACSTGTQFGLVISDPPSFARSRSRLRAARRAYVRLGALGLSLTELGGYYAAGSCTAQLAPDAFRETLSEAARRARRRLQIIHEAGQPLDHPLLAGHPEGRYLKFIVGRVLPVA
jgi:23S rRNA (cytosine1962-C5)-methyltransferase